MEFQDWYREERKCGRKPGPEAVWNASRRHDIRNGYTEEEIKQAFYKQFHLSGEQWFSYLGTDEKNNESTEDQWNEFKGYLKEIKEGEKQ